MLGLITREPGDQVELAEIDIAGLPDGEVTIDVAYSSLNYKDSLAVLSASPVIRQFPMVPGIDLVGTVSDSAVGQFSKGDWVVVNGWGLGETRWGGFAERARVESFMPIHLPAGIEPVDSMAIGTAGYTAMLCVMALEQGGVTPDDGPVIVTGASGGVGLISVLLLSELGYSVVASSGKSNMEATLLEFGANAVIGRFTDAEVKPLGSERWAGAIDSVGSKTLAAVLAEIQRDGVAVVCGLAQGMDLPTTVMPFILRGVTLIGIDSVYQPREIRQEAWARLEKGLDVLKLRQHTQRAGMDEIGRFAEQQLAGDLAGRVVVDCSLGSGRGAD